MSEETMHAVGALLEQNEFGTLGWVNELVGHGDVLCVALYSKSRRAGMLTRPFAEATGLVELGATPPEVDGAYVTVTGETVTLTGPSWSALLTTAGSDSARTLVAVESGRALLLVGHGKGWARWAETDESLFHFLDRDKRASAHHGWIAIEEGAR